MTSPTSVLIFLTMLGMANIVSATNIPWSPDESWLKETLQVDELPETVHELLHLVSEALHTSTSSWLQTPQVLIDFFRGRDWTGQLDARDVYARPDFDYKQNHEQTLQDVAIEYPYFRFIPNTVTTLKVGGAEVKWASPCFRENVASAKLNDDHTEVIITIEASKASSFFCDDSYLFGNLAGIHMTTLAFHGKHSFNWKVPVAKDGDGRSDALKWDLLNNGIKVFRFLEGPVGIASSLKSTIELYLEPLRKANVDPSIAALNVDFLEKYSQINKHIQKRGITDVHIDENEIQSGDLLAIVRLDGLDPMLGWAMGSTTGHLTVAMRDPITNDLFVCESTATTSYWEVNGIQKTPFQQWLNNAKAASFNVVWVPLSKANHAKFDDAAAWKYFQSQEGFDYGYHNMLFSWIDVLKDNYPCVAPEFKTCLTYDMITIGASMGDLLAPKLTDKIFKQAFNHRVNSKDLSPAEVFRVADTKFTTYGSLPDVVEDDSWEYETTRYGKPATGKAMVCCVFVCHMWKAAGIFGEFANSINCGEFTNYDVYALNVFDGDRLGSKRPQACIDADPDNEVCQLLGDYQLTLNDVNTKPIHAHMAEQCPSLAPSYSGRDKC